MSPRLLTDTKLINNALSTDWPNYFLANKNVIVRNPAGQVAQVKDVETDRSFRPLNCDYPSAKEMKPTLTYGMSKDSPFHSAYTKDHPLTK